MKKKPANKQVFYILIDFPPKKCKIQPYTLINKKSHVKNNVHN